VDTKGLYDILEVDQKATTDEIKKAYKKLAMKYHPDKPTGDAEKFKEIQGAHEVLSKPDSRDIYDKHGLEGLKSGGGGGDPFDMFFGGGGGPKRP
jgi:DnaJ-class molecular chaperone